MKSIQPRKKKIAEEEDLETSFKQALTPPPMGIEKKEQTPLSPPNVGKVPKSDKKNQQQVKIAKTTTSKTVKRKGKNRITIDLSEDLYAAMEKHKEATGQNFTFLISKLLEEKLLRKG